MSTTFLSVLGWWCALALVDFLMFVFWVLSAMFFTLGHWQTAILSAQEIFWLIGVLGAMSASLIASIWFFGGLNVTDY